MNGTRRDPSTRGLIPRPAEGSLRRGVGWAWLIVTMGNVILYGLAALMIGFVPEPRRAELAWWLRYLFYLPVVAAAISATMLVLRGHRRTGVGIFIGLAAMAAVGLLLMAACFGLSTALSPHH